MHERDAGHRHCFERLVGGERLQAPLTDPLLALALPFFQIGAAVEHRAVAAHEDHAYRRIALGARRGGQEGVAHFVVERVATPAERASREIVSVNTCITSSRRSTRVSFSGNAAPHCSRPSALHSGAQCWSLAVMCANLPSLPRKVADGTRPGCSVPRRGGISPSAK